MTPLWTALPIVATLVSAHPEEAPLFQETRLEGITATIHARPEPIEVGTPIVCTLRLTGPDASSAQIEAVETLGEFDLLSVSPPRNEQGFVVFDLVLSTLAAGMVTPAPLSLQWIHDGHETTGVVEFPAISVQSLLGEKIDPAAFRDIAPLYVIRGPLDWWPWAAGAAAVAAVGAAAYFLLRRRPMPALAPDAWALEELRQLEAAALPTRSEFGHYYDELTRIVRHYIALRYEIPAQQQTTREFLGATATHTEFPSDETERLRVLLRLADLVKFACAQPTRAECEANLLLARAFVERTKPVAPPTPTEVRA